MLLANICFFLNFHHLVDLNALWLDVFYYTTPNYSIISLGVSFLIHAFIYLRPLFQEHNWGVKQVLGVLLLP
jgi:hypothetical protein